MTQRRLKLNTINLVLHHSRSVLFFSMASVMFYKLFSESFPPWLEWQRTNLICFGTIFLGIGLYFARRDYLALEFHVVDLNGYDGAVAIQQLSEVLLKHNWIIKIGERTQVVAEGYNLNDRFSFSSIPKILTLRISDDQLLINCIKEPITSYRASFGGTDRVVNDLIVEFIRISNEPTVTN
jgi:hypothetical protein